MSSSTVIRSGMRTVAATATRQQSLKSLKFAMPHSLASAPHFPRTARRSVTTAAAKEIIAAPADKAPAALGPYSQAVKVGSTLYVSGCIGIIPGTKDFAGNDVAAQTEQVMKNMGAILEAAGSGFEKVVKTTILLADMGDFATVNGVYGPYFPEDPPARACFAVKELPLGALVEIEAIAIA
mmetsp:Transcript_23211/g.64456  ORF Transcript_23211/g.64456 Transcript_23211/m.64456 type:complete len:181 (+) Transcript_23211:103-645(+)|eukprot:CAMPEP_0117673710 /NCGR_PEP_ID=MMETSP0804-20121206/14622_1 /TAXON_ID=1074897 /ORGANISM="Tetraselmis astigmatica, Strain CCMP880" /LENGTH=180 /DNA_ID=CAMNT_0005482475 /DNA_START=66 /DNA_END=608 /DNA_ORIENTATION=+